MMELLGKKLLYLSVSFLAGFLPHQMYLSDSDWWTMPSHPSGLYSLLLPPPQPPTNGCHWGQHQWRQTHRWLFLWPGCTYPLIPCDPDRKQNVGQVNPSGGPSFRPHVASQEGRMRSVVLRHCSSALPSSAPTRETRLLIPGSSLSLLTFFSPSFRRFLLSLLPIYIHLILLFLPFFSLVVFSVPL